MNQTEAFHQRIDEALHNDQLRRNFRSAMSGIMARRAEQFPDDAQLQALRDQGRLLLAGPNPASDSPDPGEAGFSGSIIVAEFDSLAAAQAWADEDPYVKQGVYASVTVKPFNKVLP